jgi:tetratricopeptide (TPR) repeat protein
MDQFGLNRDYLKDRKVCVTGRLFSLTHAELAALVEGCGGTFLSQPLRCGFLLVVGDDGWPADDDASPTRIFTMARKLKAAGYAIEFITEEEFLTRVGLAEPAGVLRGLHTISDLARILNLAPARIRRWMQSGLIEPVATLHRLAYFNFHQVAFAKRLSELVARGASLAAIRAGLEQVRSCLGQHTPVVTQIANLQRDGRIVLRLGDRLVDAAGQTYFDFDANAADDAVAIPTWCELAEVAQLFSEALALEDSGRLTEAALRYERAIALEPEDPVLRFNLGNSLYAIGNAHRAAHCYREAVELDPDYAEAWNNLGNALAELRQFDDAIAALQTAIGIVPDYADAHFNLAEVLAQAGRDREAAEHQAAHERLNTADRLFAHRTQLLRIFREEAGV